MPRQFRPLIAALLILAVLLSACAPAASPSRSYSEQAVGGAMPEAPSMAPAAEADTYTTANNFSTGSAPTQRIVIKNATISIVVDSPADAMKAMSKMAEEMGGFVVTANLSQRTLSSGAEVPQASVTIRIPAEKLDDAMQRVRDLSTEAPLSENTSSQDVTQEYTDLQSRLKNLEAAEKQLALIMEAATTTEDVLTVYNQLVSVREQIEVTKGQIQYYEQSAALSSIAAELVPNEAIQPLSVGGWQPVGQARDALQALINTTQGLVNFLIWLVIYILPVLFMLFLIFVLPIILVVRGIRRRNKARKAAQPPAPVVRPPTPPAAPPANPPANPPAAK